MHGSSRFLFALVASGLFAAPGVRAAEHFMEIAEVYSSGDGDAQYVMLRMEIPFQNVVDGNSFTVQAADGSPLGTFGKFDANITLHGPGVPILIGTPGVTDAFGIVPDLVVEPGISNGGADVSLPSDGGRICWVSHVAGECGADRECDCVAYGSYSGDNSVFGSPTGALSADKALRKIAYGLNFFWAANGTDAIPMDNCRDYAYGPAIPITNLLMPGTPIVALPEYPAGCE